jgi:hypothetical protein
LSLFKKNGKVFATYSQDFLRRGLHHWGTKFLMQ